MLNNQHRENCVSNQSRDESLLSPSYQRLFVFLMFIVCLFDFADRAVFAVLAQTIKTELLLTDLQLGLLQGLAFAFLYSLLWSIRGWQDNALAQPFPSFSLLSPFHKNESADACLLVRR